MNTRKKITSISFLQCFRMIRRNFALIFLLFILKVLLTSSQLPGSSISNEDFREFKVILFLLMVLKKNQIILLQRTYWKHYRTSTDERKGFENFKNRQKEISDHNNRFERKLESFQLGINEYSDWSYDQFNKMNGLKVTHFGARFFSDEILNAIVIPAFLNYTALGFVTGVRSQGSCGSCWSFRWIF